MKKLSGLGALLLLTAAVFAQDKPVVPYVDRAAAQTLVDTLTKENETLRADSVKLRQELAALTAQVTTIKKWLADLGPVLDDLKARNADLATLADAVVDRTLKAKVLSAAEKNKAGERLITKRIDDLLAKLAALAKQIEVRTNQVSINDARSGRNTDDIIVLQATLTKTKVQEAQLQTLLDQVEGLSLRVDTVLGQTNPPNP